MRGSIVTGITRDNKGRRLRKLCRELSSAKDEEYLDSIGEDEVEELHHSWMDVSFVVILHVLLLYISF